MLYEEKQWYFYVSGGTRYYIVIRKIEKRIHCITINAHTHHKIDNMIYRKREFEEDCRSGKITKITDINLIPDWVWKQLTPKDYFSFKKKLKSLDNQK